MGCFARSRSLSSLGSTVLNVEGIVINSYSSYLLGYLKVFKGVSRINNSGGCYNIVGNCVLWFLKALDILIGLGYLDPSTMLFSLLYLIGTFDKLTLTGYRL